MYHRCHIKDISLMDDDNKTSGNCRYSKELARILSYHWKNKIMDFFEYCRGCTVCQKNKDGRTKPLGQPHNLRISDRQWEYVSIDFLTHLPCTERDFFVVSRLVATMILTKKDGRPRT